MTSRHRARHNANVRERPPQAVKRTWVTMAAGTTRETLLTPTAGYRIRLVRIWLVVTTAESSEKPLELYFGTGTNATSNRAKVIDIFPEVKSIGAYTTRTYDTLSVGRAPTGARDESISYRWQSAPANNHSIFIEYVEESTMLGKAV